MNVLNCSLQGKKCFHHRCPRLDECLLSTNGTVARQVNVNNIAMFTRQNQFFQSSEVQCPATEIGEHPLTLKTSMTKYFPEGKALEMNTAWMKQPFLVAEDVIFDNEFLKLRNYSVTHNTFDTVEDIASFWIKQGAVGYPTLMTRAIDVLLPFPTTYMFELGFSAMYHIKSKTRNRLVPSSDMRRPLSKTKPRIQNLVSQNMFIHLTKTKSITAL
ncbi:protein ZBED8-like [Homarus americanus]|uniref:protein ZBED8-like n=1 Tax=Homarus americanus TaxID=6706 RepID=UPI001C452B33|nr:protein ZBED8-like [Homarus americanus]